MFNANRRLILLIIVFIGVVVIGTIRATEEIKAKYRETYISQIYTVFSNNLQTTSEMLGRMSCYISDDGSIYNRNCLTFYKTYIQHLPINKYCIHSKQGNTNCTPNYVVDPKADCSKLYNNIVYEYSDAIKLKNNNIMIIAAKDKKRLPIFAVDINGNNPPNKAGDDLILVILRKNDTGTYYIDMNTSFCKSIN